MFVYVVILFSLRFCIVNKMEDHKNIKRSRSSNWSESEKALLTQLIKEKINLIENKDVSKNNNQLKKAAWQEILRSFNQMNDTRRDLTQLINQWRNTKNNVKKRNYEYRRSCNATGGGPRPPSPPPEDIEIMEIIPNEFEVDQNVYDSDSLNVKKDHDTKKKEYIIENVEIKRKLASSSSLTPKPMEENNIDISQPGCSTALPTTPLVKYNPESQLGCSASLPPTPKVYLKKAKKKVTSHDISESQEIFALAKSVREKQLQQQEAEHKLRMDIMQTEHKMRVEILKKESEYWEKKLTE